MSGGARRSRTSRLGGVLTVLVVAALSAGGCTTVAGDASDAGPSSAGTGADPSADSGLDEAGFAIVDAEGRPSPMDPRPTDLSAAIDVVVASGAMTRSEATLAALEGLLGLSSAPTGLQRADVQRPDLHPVLMEVSELMDAEAFSADQSARVTSALRFVRPTQAVLDAVSRPAGTPETQALGAGARMVPISLSTDRTETLAPASFALPDACQAIFEVGFSPDIEGDCYRYHEDTVRGTRVRVYYPAFWADDATRMASVTLAEDALSRSQRTYAALAGLKVPDVNVVFDLHDVPGVRAAADPYADSSGPCPVAVYPAALDDGGSDDPTAQWRFQNTLAHELFHCTQFRSFVVLPHDQNAWWAEGSADYFSTLVVQPPRPGAVYNRGVDDPHPYFMEFDRPSLRRPIDHRATGPTDPSMTYRNWVFFLYYANQRGPAALVKLLAAVDGLDDPLPALAGIQDMDQLWSDFLRDFAAGEIDDPAGNGPVETGDHYLSLGQEIQPGTEFELQTGRFVATRYLVRFAEHFGYEQDVNGDALLQTVPYDLRGNRSRWTEEPSASNGCGGPLRQVYVPSSVDQRRTSTIGIDGVSCLCPVGEADVSQAMGQPFAFPEVPDGAMDPRDLQAPGVVTGCTLESAHSNVIVLLLETDPDAFRSEVQGSADGVDGFGDAAVFHKLDQSEFSYQGDDGTTQYGGNDWALEVVVGPFVERFQVAGNIVHEEGPDAVLGRLRTLVAAIVSGRTTPTGPEDAGPSGAEPSESSVPGSDGGSTPNLGGSGSGQGGASTTGSATVEIDGQLYTFSMSYGCDISESAIDASFGGDDGFLTADSAGSRTITVSTQSSPGRGPGYRIPLSMDDPNLEIQPGGGGFYLVGEATRHDDVGDPADAGTTAGAASVAVSC